MPHQKDDQRGKQPEPRKQEMPQQKQGEQRQGGKPQDTRHKG